MPGELVTTTFAADLLRVVGPSGFVAFNLTDRAPFGWTRRAVAAIRTAFPSVLLTAEPATLRAKRLGNLVVVASCGPVPVAALRARAASSPAPYRVLDAAQVSDSFGGGTPFTEADSAPSPAPPRR